jgi:hypothetical protein
MNEHLAAVCGLYCGACSLYRARRDDNPQRLEEILRAMTERWNVEEDEIECDGCLGGGRLTPYCRDCRMRLCAEEKQDVTRCSDCSDFPCSMITDFNNDGMRHHAEVLENLRRMREIGVEKWIAAEEERWSCPGCGIQVDWYARTCFKCDATQPYRLPNLPRDEI